MAAGVRVPSQSRRPAHPPSPDLQRGEGLEGVEGPGGDGGDLVVVEREQADVAQAREAVVVDAANAVVPQHPGGREGGSPCCGLRPPQILLLRQ